LEHRLEREEQILACLKEDVASIPDMVERIYVGLDPRLKPAAGLTILAHLLRMAREGIVAAEGEPGLDVRFHLTAR
jgi:hypothetical protein